MTLDATFGPLLPPRHPGRQLAVEKWERDFAPDSLSGLNEESAIALRQVMDEISSGWKVGKVLTYDTIIIWLVDRVGAIWFALEELVYDGLPMGRPKHQSLPVTMNLPKLGHPSLINCAKARIAGEIYFDTGVAPPIWKINNNSGRYGRHPSRNSVHLDNVSREFHRHGIDLVPHFITF